MSITSCSVKLIILVERRNRSDIRRSGEGRLRTCGVSTRCGTFTPQPLAFQISSGPVPEEEQGVTGDLQHTIDSPIP